MEQRRNLYSGRRLAWAALAVSVCAIVLWEVLGGPPPDDFGYRFSPMYTLSAQGLIFWGLVSALIGSFGLLHWFYMGKEYLLRCPQCQSTISSKADWICPACGKENTPTRGGLLNILYTVLTRCKHCGKSPETRHCLQCDNAIKL